MTRPERISVKIGSTLRFDGKMSMQVKAFRPYELNGQDRIMVDFELSPDDVERGVSLSTVDFESLLSEAWELEENRE
jgi:hypothetical protein